MDASEETVKNLNAKLRYDYYLTLMDALFVAIVLRWDEFAGLDLRVQGQLGYLRNFLRKDGHRFWGEVGYDLTVDNEGMPVNFTMKLVRGATLSELIDNPPSSDAPHSAQHGEARQLKKTRALAKRFQTSLWLQM